MTRSTVTIVGAGPVGLTTAYGLARAGVDVTVLDKDPTIGSAPRAIAYLFVVHDGFARLGLLDDLHAEGLLGDGINFIDHATGEQIHHDLDALADDVRIPFTLQLGQDQLSRILLRRLAGMDNVHLRHRSEVLAVGTTEREATVRVATPEGEQTLVCDWLVGADGAGSVVRRSLDLAFDGFTWPDRFVSTNIRADLAAHGVRMANWRIDPDYGAVIARFTADDLWRFTFREAGDLPVEGLEDRIHAHFATAMPGGADYELVQYAPYRIHQRAAQTFRVGRVLLAGDAAHITNPVGGLGLTSGFLDAFVLSEALAAVVHGSCGESVLDRYAAERRRVFTDVVSPMATATKRLVFDPHPPDRKEQLLAGLRRTAQDRERRRAELLALRAAVTPSLVATTEVAP